MSERAVLQRNANRAILHIYEFVLVSRQVGKPVVTNLLVHCLLTPNRKHSASILITELQCSNASD